MAKPKLEIPFQPRFSYIEQPQCNPLGRPLKRSRINPSIGLLSILGIIAASSSADGSPLGAQQTPPPSFLCPSVDNEDFDVEKLHHIVETTSVCSLANVLSKSKRATKPRFVPEKYEMDLDGRWRRAQNYTLHGSTICPVRPASPSFFV
jgi:hypothetical protein